VSADTNEPCGGCVRKIKGTSTTDEAVVNWVEGPNNKDGKCECKKDPRRPDKTQPQCTCVENCVAEVTFAIHFKDFTHGKGGRFLEEEVIDNGMHVRRKILPTVGGAHKDEPVKLKLAADGCGDEKERYLRLCQFASDDTFPAFKYLGVIQLKVSCGYCQGECPNENPKEPDPPAAGLPTS